MISPIPAGKLAQLVEAASAVASQTDLSAVLRTTVETGIELTSARYGALGVLGEHGALVEFVHVGMDRDHAALVGQPPTGRGLLGTVTRLRAPLRIDDVAAHPDSIGFPEHHPAMDTFLGLPLRVGDEIFGNLYFTNKLGGFTQEDEVLAQALAGVAGSAISTSRLQRRLRRLAVVEDRERIARDLHDAIIQDLFAVGLSLQAQSQKVGDPEVRQSIADTVVRLDGAIAELRRFIFDLRPPIWARRDFSAEVTNLVEQLGNSYEADVHVALSGRLDDLGPAVIDTAIQVIKEGLSNALRHSGATVVTVSAWRAMDRVDIQVEDNGTGFDPDTVRLGMGLENLKSRASRADGEFTITSEEKVGTTIRVSLPI